MKRNRKVTGRALSMPAGFAIGMCVSLGTTLLLSVLLAKMISAEKIEWEKVGYGIMIILLVTSILGAKTTCIMVKRRKLLSSIIAGLLYWLGLLTITALFFGGQYSAVGITGMIILCGSALVCLQELRGERRRSAGLRRKEFKIKYP